MHLDTLKFPNGQERFRGSIGRYHNADQFIQAYHVDEDLLTNAQEKLSFVIPTALGNAEDDLIGLYGVELAVARAAIAAGYGRKTKGERARRVGQRSNELQNWCTFSVIMNLRVN